MKKLQFVLLTFILGWAINASASWSFNGDNYFSRTDFTTVTKAVNVIKATLEDQGLEFDGVIDSSNAKHVDLDLPPTLLASYCEIVNIGAYYYEFCW